MTENSFNIGTLIMLSICAAGTPRSVCAATLSSQAPYPPPPRRKRFPPTACSLPVAGVCVRLERNDN